jgi:hypothetical protein
MAYTHRVENNGEIIAWIDKDGYQIIRQPHHPQAYMNAPWSSVEEAETWASAEATKLNAAEAEAASQATKIDEIHSMLVALTNK